MNAKTQTRTMPAAKPAKPASAAPSFNQALESAKLVGAATAALAHVFARKGIDSGVGGQPRNNVQPPKRMGECGKVWAACAAHYNATGQVPTPKALYGNYGLEGANLTNVQIECYRWRAYNGMSRNSAKGGQ